MFVNELKKKLAQKQPVIGTFIMSNSPDAVEICALSGYDFVVLDNEHGPRHPQELQHMIRAAQSREITPIVRVPKCDVHYILQTLDIGAYGVQVPQINTVNEAQAVVDFAKYAPIGKRGVAATKAADYGLRDFSSYLEQANRETLVVVHCEDIRCMEALPEICQIDAVDVIFLGPYDMSQSLGITGQVTHPLVEDVAKNLLEITAKYNKSAGIFVGDGEAAKMRIDQGFTYVTINCDYMHLAKSLKKEIKLAKGSC